MRPLSSNSSKVADMQSGSQLMSTRDEFVPEQYMVHLKKLQDSAVRTQGVSNELFFCARVTGGIRKNHGPLGVVI